MSGWKRIILVVLITASCVGCDQGTKSAARAHLANAGVMSLAGDTLRLQYVENGGAFLSMGADMARSWRTLIFIAVTAVVLAAVLVYVLISESLPCTIVVALSLIAGGGIGNLTDRLIHDGRVVDFLNLGVGMVRTGIFNVADVAISVGTGLILWYTVRRHRRAGDA